MSPEPAGSVPPRPSSPLLHEAVEQIGMAEVLDPPAKKLGKAVRSALGPGKLKDALSGTWLGHALHPLLTDIPIGTWTSALSKSIHTRASRRWVVATQSTSVVTGLFMRPSPPPRSVPRRP